MEMLRTSQAVLKNYPDKARADNLSRAGYVLAILLIVAAVTLFLSTFVVGMDLISFIVKLWVSRKGVYNSDDSKSTAYSIGRILGIMTGATSHLLMATVSFPVILAFSFLCRHVSKQLWMKSVGAQALNSKEAPIIFLRPFLTDVQPIPPPDFLSFFLRRRWYPEEVFAGEVQSYPLLAIASPRSRLPSIGAAKIYVAESHWQIVVYELCRNANFILLRVGDTEGIRWEIEMLAEQVQRGIGVALLFCGPKGEPITLDDYRSFVAALPEAFGSRMPLPDDPSSVRSGYGDPAAGAESCFLVRYAAVTPGGSFIVAVYYEAATLKGYSPTSRYSAYRVDEFRRATVEALKAVPDRVGRSTNSDLHKTIDFAFRGLTLALVPYFALALLIMWYTHMWYAREVLSGDILVTGLKAVGILIISGLVTTVFVRWRKRKYFYPVAAAGAAAVLVLINKGPILNAYEVSQFMSEMAATTPSNYLETMSRSDTAIGRALYDSEKARARRIQELFGEFGESGLDEALAPGTLQNAAKRLSLATIVRLRREHAMAADQKLDFIFQQAHEEVTVAVAGFLPSYKARWMQGYEDGSNESKALLKHYARLCAAKFDDVLKLYAILDEHEHTVDGKGVVTFNDSSAVERYNKKFKEIDEVLTKMEGIEKASKAVDRPPPE
jgi:hypothetical protein